MPTPPAADPTLVPIYLRLRSGISPPLRTVPDEGPFRFDLAYEGHEGQEGRVIVEVAAPGAEVTALARFGASERFASVLRTADPAQLLPADVEPERRALMGGLQGAAQRVVDLVSQELRMYEFRTLTSSQLAPVEWSDDGERWAPVPPATLSAAFDITDEPVLGGYYAAGVQQLLARGESALTAVEHLHEARRGRGNRFRWINATIAAELAIKEVLIRLEPRYEVLLLDLPSPPLRKLYGDVLKTLTGTPSPYVSALHKGAEVRNRLVHRPDAVRLDAQEVIDYVRTVEAAIRDLLLRTRPPETAKYAPPTITFTIQPDLKLGTK